MLRLKCSNSSLDGRLSKGSPCPFDAVATSARILSSRSVGRPRAFSSSRYVSRSFLITLLILILLRAEILYSFLCTGLAVPQFMQHGRDHPVVKLLVLLVGTVGQGADQAAGSGDIRLQAHIGDRLDQFQI